jgi:hypothetical protein
MIDLGLNVSMNKILAQLRDVFDKPVANQTALRELFQAVHQFTDKKEESLKNAREISYSLKSFSLTHFINIVYLAETIR